MDFQSWSNVCYLCFVILCRYLQRKWFQLFPLEIIYLTDHLNCMKTKWLENALIEIETLQIPVPPIPQTVFLTSIK